MADGQVFIDSKLDTGGVTKGTNKMQKEFDQLAKVTKRTAQIMEQELKNIQVDNVAEGMSESFESELEQVERVVEQTSDSVKENADQMSDAMRDAADDQADAMREAWDETEDKSRTGSRKVRDDLDDIGDEAKETGKEIESSIGNAFASLASKIGGIMATAFAVDELFEFGKEAVELGSALSEVQNVVDVTFGKEGSKVIDKFAKNAIKEFGLSELSAKQFSSTMGAMLKSMGDFDDTQILDMSTALAGLAGDMASFYNIDAQEAFDKLRSGISGETEPLKQLGINLSVANLEAFALAEGIKKSYDKMTEQEKALLRYNYILKATKSASGDFSRTQYEWANQTRILTEEFNSLKGTIGQGLINVLNPLVTSINGRVMPVLQGLADKFVQLTETFSWDDLFGDVDFGPIVSSLGEFGAKCQELSTVVGSGLKWAWDNVLVPLGTWSIEAGLPAALDALGAAFGELAAVFEWLSPLASAIWNDFLQPIASWVGDAVVGTLKALADAFNFLTEMFQNPAVDSVTWFTEAMGRAGEYAYTGMIDPISAGLDEISTKGQEAASNLSTELQNATTATSTSSIAAVQDTINALGSVAEAEQQSITAASDAITAGNEQLIANATENIAAANETLVASSAETSEQISTGFSDAAEQAKTAWDDMGPWFDSSVAAPIESSIEGISKAMANSLSSMQAQTASAWAAMLSIVQNSVSQMQAAINSITGKTVYVNVVKTGDGAAYASASAGYDGQAYTPATYDITPQIPYLATGAVIPPRAPFMAMLGDQANGRNLEAPEELLRQIVREESGREIEVISTINFEGTLSQLIRMLYPEIKTEAHRRGNSLAKEVIE